MTDNTWDPEAVDQSGPTDAASEGPSPLHPSGDRSAESTSRFALPVLDSTDEMPNQTVETGSNPIGRTPQRPSSIDQPTLPAATDAAISRFAPPAATAALPSIPAPAAPVPPAATPALPQAGAATGTPAASSLGVDQIAPAVPQMPPSVRSNGWSPLGATPAGPPVSAGPGTTGGQYLPPVAPPQKPAIVAEPVPVPKSNARWGWRALVSFLAGGLIAATGFGAAQLNSQTDSIEAAATTVPATTIPAASRDTGNLPPNIDEPAAFVAKALGPSVVQIETDLGLGSGVIFGDGLILTNNHVVTGAQAVRVELANGRVLPAQILGADVNTDVAVVSVGPGLDLPIAELATGEKVQVGQVAIAIGSPFDLQQSVTAGIVSAIDRPIQNGEQSVVAMIQTDAPINRGNSGGALADRLGRVIGINTSIQTDGVTSANLGVGFAIPIDTAIRIADLLVAGEPIQPGFLGVRGEEPPGGEAGVRLTEVTVGSAAESAGLLVGDRVLSLNGAPVTQFAQLAGLVLANQAGDTVTLELIRDGRVVSLDVTLGLREEN